MSAIILAVLTSIITLLTKISVNTLLYWGQILVLSYVIVQVISNPIFSYLAEKRISKMEKDINFLKIELMSKKDIYP